MYLATRKKARQVLIRWLNEVTKGGSKRTLDQVARDSGIKPSRLRRVLRKDAKLQEEFLGPLDVEMRLAMKSAVERGLRVVLDEETPSSEVRLWMELLAKMTGGVFDARNRQPLVLLQQLVPDLPPQAKHIQTRVLNESPGDADLQKLTEGT